MRGQARVAVLSGVVLVLCNAGCGADNGKLFNDVLTGTDGPSAEPPPAMPEPETLPPTPPTSPSGEPTPGEAPLAGQIPALVRPTPPSAPEEPPPAQPAAAAGPVIVSVSPEDGALGVENDAPIVLRFSEPMDRPSTEAAYQSELVPNRSVAFSWNEDSTELTITPSEPLEYGVGGSPELAEARRVSFFVSASAASAAGQPLDHPYEFSFSLLRQVAFSVPALADRGKSGNFRSNDSYGSGDCAEDEPNVCVGDQRVGRQNEQYKGFISFELDTALPADARQVAVALSLELSDTAGNPFAGLGSLVLEHVRFDEIGLDAFDADPLDTLGPIASAGAAGAVLGADVSGCVLDDLDAAESLTQYRLSFEAATDADNASDAIISALDTHRLDGSFLVP